MKRFGKYLLVRKIASGGMADVFKAKALGIRGFTKTLAIKRIHPHLADDNRFIRMFTDEAKIAAALVHPNVVQIYDLGEEEGVPYIAMEYVPGRDLLEVMRRCHQVRRRFPVALACRVVSEVCEGLGHAHEFRGLDGLPQEIVHRDVTPRNVLLGFGGSIKLTDFGVARARLREEKTEAGLIKGKVRYLSTEAAAGAEVDRRSDLYSLGAVFIELLSMRPLYDAGSEIEVLIAISEGRFDRSRLDEVPPQLVPVIDRALAADREQRYPTARAMKDGLLKAAGDLIEQVQTDEVASAMQFLFGQEVEDERQDDRETEAKIVERARKHSRPGVPRPSPMRKPGPPPMPDDTDDDLDALPAVAIEDVIPLAAGEGSGDTSALDIEILTPVPQEIEIDLDATDWDEVEVSESRAKNPLGASESQLMSALTDDDSAEPADLGDDDLSIVPDIRAPQPSPGGSGEVRPVPPASEVSPFSQAPTADPDETPDFEGDLSRSSLIRVFSQLAEEKASGRLDVRRDPVQKAIFFSNGEPLFATSNVQAELFGEHLVSRGIISRDALDEALSEAAVKHMRLTQALLTISLLAPHDLYRHLSEQVRDKILDLFSWGSGRYAFFSGAEPPEAGFPLGLSAYGLILEGAREHVSRVSIRRDLEPYLGQVITASGKALPSELHLSGKEQRVVRIVETGGVTLEKLLEQTGDEELGLQVVYLLKEIQHLSFA